MTGYFNYPHQKYNLRHSSNKSWRLGQKKRKKEVARGSFISLVVLGNISIPALQRLGGCLHAAKSGYITQTNPRRPRHPGALARDSPPVIKTQEDRNG